MREPRQTVRDIDAALAKAIRDEFPSIEVHLSWTRYKDLLDLKGITWEPTDHSFWARHDSRPLTEYRGYPLILVELNNPQSQVLGRFPGGSIRGWAVCSPYP